METFRDIPKSPKPESFFNEAIEAGVIDSPDLEFKTSDLNILRRHEGGTFPELKRREQSEIEALERKLEKLRQDYTDAMDGFQTSRHSVVDKPDEARELKKLLILNGQIHSCDVDIETLKQHGL